MPSEREIRNLYVNGRTICIEVFFCFLKFFSVRRTRSRHRMGTILGAWGGSLNKHFGRCNPAKIAKHVYVCIACHTCPEFGTILVIPKVGLSRILQRKPVTKAFFNEIFGITFCWFALSGQSNFRIWKNNSG